MYFTQKGWSVIHKFGRLSDVGIGSTPEDIWDGDGLYPFPSATAVTTVVSDSTDDDDGGIGVNTIFVEGLDSDYNSLTEQATMNGTTTVTLTNQFLRVFRVSTILVGSSESNIGTIQVKHGATVLAQIGPSLGQTLMAIYTIPNDLGIAYLANWYMVAWRQAAASVEVAFQVKKVGEGWQTEELIGINTQGGSPWDYKFPYWVELPKKADVRCRVIEATANNMSVSAGFDVIFVP